MPSHTSSPVSPPSSWFAEVGHRGFWHVFDGDSVVIASRCVLEDAHLIAAAPDLLAAGRMFLRLTSRNRPALGPICGFSVVEDAINAAIDKAMAG